MKISEMSHAVLSRFWSKVNKNGAVSELRPDLGNCWLWTGNTHEGYGKFHVHRVPRMALMARQSTWNLMVNFYHLPRLSVCEIS